jgi:hypothetical protein
MVGGRWRIRGGAFVDLDLDALRARHAQRSHRLLAH